MYIKYIKPELTLEIITYQIILIKNYLQRICNNKELENSLNKFDERNYSLLSLEKIEKYLEEIIKCKICIENNEIYYPTLLIKIPSQYTNDFIEFTNEIHMDITDKPIVITVEFPTDLLIRQLLTMYNNINIVIKII